MVSVVVVVNNSKISNSAERVFLKAHYDFKQFSLKTIQKVGKGKKPQWSMVKFLNQDDRNKIDQLFVTKLVKKYT